MCKYKRKSRVVWIGTVRCCKCIFSHLLFFLLFNSRDCGEKNTTYHIYSTGAHIVHCEYLFILFIWPLLSLFFHSLSHSSRSFESCFSTLLSFRCLCALYLRNGNDASKLTSKMIHDVCWSNLTFFPLWSMVLFIVWICSNGGCVILFVRSELEWRRREQERE